ncbi:CoxG family protein [Oceanobacillus sp. Castelsardo]|uniref:CoxG family protein n=1 Tax=Oceanobacillus sp. Castelsardo TaxID=1851204 RepID=UPI00083824BA|nr:SRPBCC family protein [Oceanobacillus sp. Castelsardo]
MGKGIHCVELDTPVSNIWDFVSDMNKWAPLVPGYVSHQIIDDRHSVWIIHGDIGIMERTVALNIKIVEWIENETIIFQVATSNETCKGEGCFEVEALSDTRSKMKGYLQVHVKGMVGTMVNPVLKTLVPKVGKDFTDKIATNIMERETARATI